jgi:tripartite-type tricarboxylate transporter receptor subunit TctC
MQPFMRCLIVCLLAPASLLAAATGQAQDYPTKPVRLIIGFPPGGVNDILGRILSNGMGKFLGQSVLVENKPGAGGMISTEYVAKQVPADGYTVLITSVNLPTYTIYNKLTYDPVKDLRHVSILVDGPLVMWVNVQTPITTFQEFVAYAKANPGKLNFSAPGLQSSPAIFQEGMRQRLGIDIVTVPFKGTADGRAAILANEVQLSINDSNTAIQEAQAGRGRALIVSGSARLPALPSVPTVNEVGMPDLLLSFWSGMAVPVATPAAIVNRLSAAVTSTMSAPDSREQLIKAGFNVIATSPEAATKRIVSEHANFAAIAAKAGIKPQ